MNESWKDKIISGKFAYLVFVIETFLVTILLLNWHFFVIIHTYCICIMCVFFNWLFLHDRPCNFEFSVNVDNHLTYMPVTM